MSIPTVTIAQILPTKVWIENGMMGERVVVLQHEGFHPFDYAVFNYDYAYTSNSGTLDAAERLARALGATDPIEHRSREMPTPTAEEMREQLAFLTERLRATGSTHE